MIISLPSKCTYWKPFYLILALGYNWRSERFIFFVRCSVGDDDAASAMLLMLLPLRMLLQLMQERCCYGLSSPQLGRPSHWPFSQNSTAIVAEGNRHVNPITGNHDRSVKVAHALHAWVRASEHVWEWHYGGLHRRRLWLFCVIGYGWRQRWGRGRGW